MLSNTSMAVNAFGPDRGTPAGAAVLRGRRGNGRNLYLGLNRPGQQCSDCFLDASLNNFSHDILLCSCWTRDLVKPVVMTREPPGRTAWRAGELRLWSRRGGRGRRLVRTTVGGSDQFLDEEADPGNVDCVRHESPNHCRRARCVARSAQRTATRLTLPQTARCVPARNS